MPTGKQSDGREKGELTASHSVLTSHTSSKEPSLRVGKRDASIMARELEGRKGGGRLTPSIRPWMISSQPTVKRLSRWCGRAGC